MKKGLILFLFLGMNNFLFAQEKDSVQPISTCVEQIYLPNAFTGSGDGINDIFIPRMIGEPKNYSFMIFNRWGEIIFNTNKPEEGWRGTHMDQRAQSDVYVWMIEFTCPDDERKYKFTGQVTILR